MKKSITADSLTLIIVNVVTLLTGIIKAMILARVLTKNSYGMYNQVLLVTSFVTPFLALGLSGTINYFYNKCTEVKEQQSYVNTIFSITIMGGVLGSIVIIVFQAQLANYFSNPSLIGILAIMSISPLISNTSTLLQPLYISVGKTRIIAIRNLVLSLLQLLVLGLVAFLSSNIYFLLVASLLLDILQLAFLYSYFNKKCFKIRPMRVQFRLIKPIMVYAIPMAISTLLSTVSLSMDKLIIGRNLSVEDFAVFSVASRELPFSIVSNAFTTIILPIFILKYANQEFSELKKLWSNYLEIGYTCTFVLCSAAIISAREIMIFLYSDKYLPGLNIFIVYVFVSMIRFSSFGIISIASGNTKIILYSTLVTLLLNFVGNIVLLKWIGIIGPAVATLITTSFLGIFLYIINAKMLGSKLSEGIRLTRMIKLLFCIAVVAIFVLFLDKYIFIHFIEINVLRLLTKSVIFVGIIFIIYKKRIAYLVKELNKCS